MMNTTKLSSLNTMLGGKRLSALVGVALFVPGTHFATSVWANTDESAGGLSLVRLVDQFSLNDLADVVVTDTKIAQSRDSVTQRIAVLRQDDIERQPTLNRNLADLSMYVSGQFVNVLSRNDANWGSYAGLGPKYNSYLLDGLPMDSFVDAMSLELAAIERVEIQKGPASVLYSNYLSMDFVGNATPLAGTTNFILKSRIDQPLTRATMGLGSCGGRFAQLYRQGGEGALSYMVGVSADQADYTQVGEAGSWLQTTRSPEYTKTKWFARAGLALGRADHTLSVFVQETRHDGTLGRPNRDFDHRYDTLNLAYNNAFTENWNLQFKIGQRHYDRSYANDDYPTSLAFTHTERTRQIIRPMDLTFSYLHGQESLLTLGADRQTVHYWVIERSPLDAQMRRNDASAESTGFFIQEKWHWGDWVFRGGLRRNKVQHDYMLLGGNAPAVRSAKWEKTLWSLGARYRLAPALAIYANAGTSFMPPAAKQIGGTVNLPNASGELANPALKPESGTGIDLGIDWQPLATATFGVRLFDNRISNAIVSSIVSADPSQSRSENAGKARAQGIELDWNQAITTDVAWFANLTRTQTRLDNPVVRDQDDTSIPFTPGTLMNAGVSASLPAGFKVFTYAHWVGRYYDSASRASRLKFGDYGTLNLRLLKPLSPGLDLTVDLINLTDRRYDLPFSFRDPGFNGQISLSLAF